METNLSKQSSPDIFKLLQPDLLSVDELVHILKERGVKSCLLSQNKETLVSLFKRVALPLPQRELRLNYRGTLLLKLRKKFERRKIELEKADESKSFTLGVTGSARLSKEENSVKSSGERLKPPPDLINYERKKIRLNSSSSSSTGSQKQNTDLEKVVIKKRNASESSLDSLCEKSDIKNELKGEKNELSTVSDCSATKDTINTNGAKSNSLTAPKKVTLKRNYLSSSKPSPATSKDSSDQVKEPDKKRKPISITWP